MVYIKVPSTGSIERFAVATTAQKLKLMYLAKLLESETDDEHGLTGPQIIQRLAELGIAVERKTLYRDLDCLREFGYNIVKYQRSPIEYGLASREFQESELLLLADAVQSSRFLTERKSNALVKAIGKLGSKYLADDLRRNLHVEGRIRSQNESVFYNIDAIQRAISAKKKVRFRYDRGVQAHRNTQKRCLIWEPGLKVWLIPVGGVNTISYLHQTIEGK